MDYGQPISYQVLEPGTPVYTRAGEQIGKVAHVLAVQDEDVFDGIVIGEHQFGRVHRFADADDVERIFEHGVVLRLDMAACEQLSEPSANPAVMRDDPAESNADRRHEKLMRAWDLISGNRCAAEGDAEASVASGHAFRRSPAKEVDVPHDRRRRRRAAALTGGSSSAAAGAVALPRQRRPSRDTSRSSPEQPRWCDCRFGVPLV